MEKQSYTKHNNPSSRLKMKWKILRDSYLDYAFPDEHGYLGSQWVEWEERIKNGQKKEEERISKRLAKLELEEDDMLPDWLAEDYIEACHITNKMYAALIVSMWAELESFFKNIIIISSQDLNIGTPDLRKLTACDIQKYFKKAMEINLKEAPNFYTINAIRVFCNTFKHNNGRYQPNPDNDDDINNIQQDLIDRWKMLEEYNNINYTILPIKELVLSSHQFIEYLMKEVFDKIENHLNASN